MAFQCSFKAIASAAALFVYAQTSAAQYVLDGTFTNPAPNGAYDTYLGGSSMGPWLVTGQSVDLIGNYWQAGPNGSNSVDLNGNDQGGLSQVLNLAAGDYVLSFYTSVNPFGPPTSQLTAQVGTAPAQTFTATNSGNGNNMNFHLETMPFTMAPGTTSTTLSFSSLLQGSSTGPVLADVSIAAAVPEPDAMALMWASLGVVVGMKRRRRQANTARQKA